jgi:hypothetical protein
MVFDMRILHTFDCLDLLIYRYSGWTIYISDIDNQSLPMLNVLLANELARRLKVCELL